MKDQLFPYLTFFSRIAGIPLYTQLTGERLLLPFYHTISNVTLPHIEYLYPVRNMDIFREDLDFFLENFIPIDLPELIALVENKEPLKRNYFHLTFDDGLAEFHDLIAPVLKEKGIPATIFLNPAFVDNKELFYRYKASSLIHFFSKEENETVKNQVRKVMRENGMAAKHMVHDLLNIPYNNKDLLNTLANILDVDFLQYLEEKKPYLSEDQIRKLAKEGFTFGAHSWDHPDFRELTLDEQLFQARQSIQYVNDLLGVDRVSFAFPFTDDKVDEQFFHELHRKNPSPSLTFGSAGLKHDSAEKNLQRIPMEGTLLPASSIVRNEYLYYMLKAPVGKNIISRD